MGMEKLYDYLPKSRRGRSLVGLLLILFGLFSSAAILTIILIPLGIVVLAFDYAWARKILKAVRDGLNHLRARFEAKETKPNKKTAK